jgi:hypothetical protein
VRREIRRERINYGGAIAIPGPGVNWAITLTRLNATVAFPDTDEFNVTNLTQGNN